MGVDIQGWVECRDPDSDPACWFALFAIDNLVGRNYDIFGLLFGVRNHTDLEPAVPIRGLPEDSTEEGLQCAGRGVDATWITWAEIRDLDWNESAIDHRPHCYVREPDGRLVLVAKALPVGDFAPPQGVDLADGAAWERDGRIYRVERITRRQILERDTGWHLIFDLMARLARDFGAEGVRLVVSFDV